MFSPECLLFSSSFTGNYFISCTLYAYYCVKHCLDKNERGDQGKIQVGGQKYSHTYPYRCSSPPGQQQHAMRKQCKFFVF